MPSTGKKSLYKVIMEDIMTEIKNSQFSFEKPICTEKSICEKYGVSVITAKKALGELEHSGILYRKRGSGSYVSREILTRKANIIEEKLLDDKTKKHVVAFMLPFDIMFGGVLDMVRAAGQVLDENGYYLSLHISGANSKKEKQIIEELYEKDVSALIYYPTQNNMHEDKLMLFISDGKPVVVVDLLHNCNFIYSVVSDNVEGQRMMTQHLLDRGHKRIAYVHNVPIDKVPSVRDRLYGYCLALKQNGIEMNWDYVKADLPIEHGEELFAAIAGLVKAGVTAIEAENDDVAYRILQACKSMQINVPQDLSITGFDDSRIATQYGADITTVHQDFAAMGELAAKIIVNDLANQHSYDYKQILPVKIVERSSAKNI